MLKHCRVSGAPFEISSDEEEFLTGLGVPMPTLHPIERQRRRLAFRNFRSLYHREASQSGRRILSMYSAAVPFPVLEQNVWWGDDWDARSFGRDVDFTKPFFEQYRALSDEVPRFPMSTLQCENCDFTNLALQSKNCYLVFGCVRNEDCLYGHIVWDSKSCLECLYIYKCEACSHSVDLVGCYDVHYSTEASNCSESYFLHDCQGCRHCYGCTNLRNKEYCFLNTPLSREAYENRLAQLLPLNHETVAEMTAWLESAKRDKAIWPELFSLRSEDCSGNHIYDSRNIRHGFDVKASEDGRYLFTHGGGEHVQDISFSASPHRYAYECLTINNAERTIFSHLINNSADIAYSEFIYSSHDLFGCNGLRNAAHCILNKQYSEKEYAHLRARLIEHMKSTGEWGEFFPIQLSPFAYNESIAQEYFPVTALEAKNRGWNWRAEPEVTEDGVLLDVDLQSPEEAVVRRIFRCAETGKPYRIGAFELRLCRTLRIPLPNLCPDVRHQQRMALRHSRALAERLCAHCETRIQSAIPASTAKVFCMKCYLESLG